ncbi:SapB/AmfS family lanthipeptide [Herbidospora mongoliensis]|nr:SapB/AmfS family lanthipeptide [Herbidospora mongoliensis]
MVLLDLQAMELPGGGGGHGGGGGGGGGSTLTLLGCASQTPSNLSLLLCH